MTTKLSLRGAKATWQSHTGDCFALLAMTIVLFVGALVFAADTGKKYSVEIRNAPIGDVVRMLAHMDEKNVVVPDKIEGMVTASFDQVELERALAAILESNGLGAVVKGDIIQVSTREVLEKLGEDLIMETMVLRYAKAALVAAQVQSLISERGSVMIDERTNALTVRDAPVKVADIRQLIGNIDKIDRQVLIEAKVVEAKIDFLRSLGIQWGVTKSAGDVRTAGLVSVGEADSGRLLNVDVPVTAPLAGASLALGSFAGVFTDVQLTAAESHGDLSILSRPSVVTLNNQSARIHSGVKFYVKTSGDVTIGGTSTGSSASTSSNLQQIDAGITMMVTPQITVDDKINLVIDVTESQPDFTRAIDGIPAIVDNNATTTVLLNDGEPTVIGGLFQLQKNRTKKGVPGLMRVPLFGSLFRSSTKLSTKNELLIFIKPTIVKGSLSQLPTYSDEEEATLPSASRSRPSRKRR